jgi:hypothetical protein
VAINTGYVVVSVLLMHRRILRGQAWNWYLNGLLAPGAAVTAIAAAFAAWRHTAPGLSQPALLLLVLACGGCAVLAALSVAPLARRAAVASLMART